MVVRAGHFKEVVEHLSLPGVYGLDTETEGLGWDDRLFAVILATSSCTYYFDFNDLFSPSSLGRVGIKDLQPIFQNPLSIFYAHNAKFDWHMLAKEGIEITSKVYCSYVGERVLKNNHFDGSSPYSLDAVARRSLGLEKSTIVEDYIAKNKLFDIIKYPGKKKTTKRPFFAKVPTELMAQYACKDAELHLQLGFHQRNTIRELSLKYPPQEAMSSLEEVLENETRLIRTCVRMEQRGLLIDKLYIKEAMAYEESLVDHWAQEFKNLTDLEFQDSKTVLVEAFKRLNLTFPVTEKGNPSFSEDSLESVDNPVSNIIKRIRFYQKRIGTYYSSFLTYTAKDGRIHPNSKQAGTETGRFSYSEPNLQNLSKEEESEERFLIRGCIIPAPGKCLVSVDFRQMEFRLLLDYAAEAEAIERVNDGEDVHSVTAQLTGLSRSQAKNVGFAILYGAGNDKLASMIGVTPVEAAAIREQFLSKLTGVRKFIETVKRVGRSRGYVRNWYGRVLQLANPDWAYILVNHLIQGGSADVVKVAMNQLDELNAPLILQVHDELVFEMSEEQFSEVEKYQEIMESVYVSPNGMRLTTSVTHSWKSWANVNQIKGAPHGKTSDALTPSKKSPLVGRERVFT